MIRVSNLSLWFGDTPILADLSFEIGREETLAIIGESGGGKTSLGRLLLGLIPRYRRNGFRWSGDVTVEGIDPSKPPRNYRGRKIGLIVQAMSDALNPHLTVRQHVAEMLSVHRLATLDVSAVCLACNIPKTLLDRYPATLSGGETQRVLAALALVSDPPSLVLDEPTASLDQASRALAIAAFARGSGRRSQLLITHDLDLVRRMAQRVGVLHGGRLIELDASERVLNHPAQTYTRNLVAYGRLIPRPVRMVPQSNDALGVAVSALSHAYGPTSILHDVALTVRAGTCTAIVGESGSGKSTLARLLTGFEAVQSGRIELPSGPAALISQHPHRALAPHFTVAAVLAEALKLTNAKNIGGDTVDGLLQRVGLPAMPEFLARRTAVLSGGEAQRLVIARALVGNPACLVADEPTSALDGIARMQILALLRSLVDEAGIALVLFTHDLDAAEVLADQTMELNSGRLSPLIALRNTAVSADSR